MTDRLRALRQSLLMQRDEIVNLTSKERQELRTSTGALTDVCDEADLSARDLLTELDGALLELGSETIEMIDDALGRIEAGTYGRCEDCGTEISPARLRALPTARRCRACEQAWEDERNCILPSRANDRTSAQSVYS